jgi:lipopolysaccharide transport protein LptA
MESDWPARRVIFTGQVVAKLEGATITADRMDVYLDEEGERVLRIVSTGNVKLVTGDGRHGTALRAEYDDAEQHVRLLGDAKVWFDESVVIEEKITVSLVEEGRGRDARCPAGAWREQSRYGSSSVSDMSMRSARLFHPLSGRGTAG